MKRKKSILKLKGVGKVFGVGRTAVVALKKVDFTLNTGEITLIMGPSGSGKTTLLSIAGGILKPSEGSVVLKKYEIGKMEERDLVKVRLAHIGFIFQAFYLLASLTALENVQLAQELAGITGKKGRDKAKAILTKLDLADRMNDIPANLSGGEKQRVAISRALINDPDVILADEPTANLDSKTGHEVMLLLKDVAKKNNKSVLIVSHDNRIRDIADRILWLEDGKFKELGKMAVDPVCQMSVEKGEYKYKKRGEEYFFCSKGCRDEFVGSKS